MFVVALTGGIGCGKSAATEIFAQLGVNIVDLDLISHKLTASGSPLLSEITALFGTQILDETGALNRSKMRQLVFSDASQRFKLEAILHPAIYAEAVQELKLFTTLNNKKSTYQVLAIPLLTENSRYQAIINRVLVIDCDEKLQIKRTIKRSKLSGSNLTNSEVNHIMSAQISRENRLKLADDVIENNESLSKLRKKIELIHKKYINTCIVSK